MPILLKTIALQEALEDIEYTYRAKICTTEIDGFELNKIYKDYIPPRWYGFDIGSLIPYYIVSAIKSLTDFLIKNFPEVHILQVKWKFGGLRYYTDNLPEHIELMISRFTSKIYYDKARY